MLKLTSASVILFCDMHISVNSCSASMLGTPTMLFWSSSSLVRTSSAWLNLSQRKQSNIISPSISPVHLQWRKWNIKYKIQCLSKVESQWDFRIATILCFTLMILLSWKHIKIFLWLLEFIMAYDIVYRWMTENPSQDSWYPCQDLNHMNTNVICYHYNLLGK